MVLEKIVGSKAKVKIIKALAHQKELQLYEIQKSTKMSSSTLHEAVKDLVKLRILSIRKIGKTKLYKLNLSNYFARVARDFVLKEEKFLDIIINEFTNKVKKIKNILNITLFGSALRLKELPTDIDVIIICKFDKFSVKEKVLKIEDELLEKYDIQISSLIFDKQELIEKAKKNERFLINVIAVGKCLYGKKLEVLAYGKRSK